VAHPQNGRSPRRARRLSICVVPGALSHREAMVAWRQGAGPAKPVRVASRRSRARAARALTGFDGLAAHRTKRSWLGAVDEVYESMILDILAQNCRLRAKSAHRCSKLILLPSSTHQPGRTSRLLSCYRSVGSLHAASLALYCANLRSDRKPMMAPEQQFACRLIGAGMPAHWRAARQEHDKRTTLGLTR